MEALTPEVEEKLSALIFQQERERGEWAAERFRYQLALDEHGISLEEQHDPLLNGVDGVEMFKASKRVVLAAAELLAALKALERIYGTSMELVGGEPWDRA